MIADATNAQVGLSIKIVAKLLYNSWKVQTLLNTYTYIPCDSEVGWLVVKVL